LVSRRLEDKNESLDLDLEHLVLVLEAQKRGTACQSTSGHLTPSLPSRTVSKHICLNCRTASSSVVLTLIGALVVTHAMLRRLTSWRCIIIIIIISLGLEEKV